MPVTFKEMELAIHDLPGLDKVKRLAHEAGFNLLFKLDEMTNKATTPESNFHTVCTSESLTAGMIMSTLVDIPWMGAHKYGGFAVYDTDAKRVFNKVAVDNVYTHRCAKEMAIGVLKNSNATISISVTGNAMPTNTELNKLGEVFIGVAGYIQDGPDTKIIYDTMVINACSNKIREFRKTCKAWHKTLKAGIKDVYNSRSSTALISQEIRYYTACKALEFCLKFTNDNNLVVPEFIVARKARNGTPSGPQTLHSDTPENKYDEHLQELHVSHVYNASTPTRRSADVALYNESSPVNSGRSNGSTPPSRQSSLNPSQSAFAKSLKHFQAMSRVSPKSSPHTKTKTSKPKSSSMSRKI